MSMTQTQVTRNGHSISLVELSNGWTQVRSARFTNAYVNAEYAAHVANIVFVWMATGCYACGVERANAKRPHLAVRDTTAHAH